MVVGYTHNVYSDSSCFVWLQIKRHCKLVHGSMVYTECVLRQQQFRVASNKVIL